MTKLLFANSSDRNMFYASRARIHDPFFLLEKDGKRYVFLNGLELGAYTEKNTKSDIVPTPLEDLLEGLSKVDGEGSGAGKLAYVILQEYGAESETVSVPANFPVDIADFLRSKDVEVKVLSPVFPERAVKRADEIAALREVCKLTEVAFEVIERILEASVIAGNTLLCNGQTVTSEYLKIEAERALLEKDLMNVEDLIISCGPQAAMPHHRGSGPIHPYQTIVCDIYPQHRSTGYFADISRTYIKGEPSVEIQKMYSAVFEAQRLAIEAVKPGVSFDSVQNVAQEYFTAHGFEVGHEKGFTLTPTPTTQSTVRSYLTDQGKKDIDNVSTVGVTRQRRGGFTHSIGHGLGVEVHEQPFVHSKSEALLEPGNVITIEPGLYYPGLGGIRIEDVVLVTPTGFELLSPYPKRWIV